MSSKVKRKVTVENTKESADQPRRPSVFERLGPGAVNVPTPQSQDRHSRIDHNEKCRNWLRSGNCSYGSTCRFQHEQLYSATSKRPQKTEKEVLEKDLRHKVKKQKEEPKESRTGSLSPQRKGKTRSSSRSRKGEHESKIKSTVVVTRPRSPAPGITAEGTEEKKKKPDGSWEEDSDEWPMDAAQLDYKEELTLERKRQQLQRELELLQKERMLDENVTITKTVSFSESSSTTSSSDSGSVSSSSDSSSSSSDDDSDESSSSSSSTSSSASRTSKKKYKKSTTKKVSSSAPAKKSESSSLKKPLDDYDKIKSSRNAKAAAAASRSRVLSPVSPETSKRRGKDYHVSLSPPQSPKHHRSGVDSSLKSGSRAVRKGPRTPSPLPSKKDRPWSQRSSADSRAGADSKRSKGGKRHKKKKDSSRSDSHKYSESVPVPPRLSSPNRTALQSFSAKKSWSKEETSSKSRHKHKDHSPLLGPKYSSTSNSPANRHSGGNSSHQTDKDKHHTRKRSKSNQRGKKSDDNLPHSYKLDHREHSSKHSKLQSPPLKDSRQSSVSPQRLKTQYESESFSRRHVYSGSGDKIDKRRGSPSPSSRNDKDSKDHRKKESGNRKDLRDISPRSHDSRRDSRYQDSDLHGYSKKGEQKVKRLLSPEAKKVRDDRKNHGKDRDSWIADQKKGSGRISDSRGHLDESSRSGRDRKKGKDRDLPPLRDDKDRDRQRLSPPPPPIRKGQDVHPHHVVREEPPIPVPRGRIYEADLPTDERDYAYAYPPHREPPPYLDERALPPEFDPELLHHGPPLYPPPPAEAADYPPPVFADPLYRRDIPLKDPSHIERITGYVPRDISPLDPRDPVVLPREMREEDYLDMTIDERRAYDERWGRNRPLREDWDPFAGLPPPGLPPHVGASLDEDRYGMPRRRRASPEWHMHRGDERDLPIRDRRSRSPHRRPDEPPGRGPWRDDRGGGGDRHANRNNDLRNNDNIPKDDRKNRNYRRDRRELNKKSDDSSGGQKPKEQPKEKSSSQKRTHSSSPVRKDVKRRKEETSTDTAVSSSDKSSSSKKSKEDSKQEAKPVANRKPIKTEPVAGKQEQSSKPDKKDGQDKTGIRNSSKPDADDKKKRINDSKSQVDDDFSDWSDGDDDLLNRDLNDVESNAEKAHGRTTDDAKKEKRADAQSTVESKESKENSSNIVKRKRDGSKDSRTRTNEIKSESRSRTGSKERPPSENNSSKTEVVAQSSKESELSEGYVVKDEAVGEPDDFVTTESVDYDPISDDELEAMIEEPSDSVVKPEEGGKTKIVDALDVDWSVLMSDTKPEFVPGNAKKRFKTAHVLSRIGFSQSLAGPELSQKLIDFCQKQLDEEKDEETDGTAKDKKFQMEHHIAAFHVTLAERKEERENIFNRVGPARRALCARQDLHIRKLLCRPSHKLVVPSSCVQQHGNVDLKNQKVKTLENRTPVVNTAC